MLWSLFGFKMKMIVALFSKIWYCISLEASFVHVCEVSDGKWPKVFEVSDVYAIRCSRNRIVCAVSHS